MKSEEINLIENLLNFLHLVEKLKCITRHGWTSTGRQESVADHCWRLSLLVILCSKCFDRDIDLEKALKIAVIHDIAEAITGDIPYFLARENSKEKKLKGKREKLAIENMEKTLDEIFGEEIFELWKEYEENKSYEAKIIKALDKIEAQIQQNEADLSTWLECEREDAVEGYITKYCQFDSFLYKLSERVINESKAMCVQLLIHTKKTK